MSPKLIVLILLSILAFYNTAIIYFNHSQSTSYEVRIINGFTNNSSLPLVVWCASHDTGDIGGRALQEKDDYGWTVRILGPVSWSSSRFICTVKWDRTMKEFTVFSATTNDGDGSLSLSRCGPLGKCLWLVKEDGFYFSNDGVEWNKEISWER